MRETGDDGNVFAIRIQCLLTGPELVAFSFPFGKPVPVLMLRILFRRQAYPIGEKDECRPLG
jgi:hypothetical protein